MLKLDTHAHWFPPEWVALLEREGGNNGVQMSRNENAPRSLASRDNCGAYTPSTNTSRVVASSR